MFTNTIRERFMPFILLSLLSGISIFAAPTGLVEARDGNIYSLDDSFVYVEGGEFMMGHEDMVNESPIHPVYVDGFWISPYEIYNKLWDDVYKLAKKKGYVFTTTGRRSDPAKPVVRVSWRNAIVWCNAYSEIRGYTPVYRIGTPFDNNILRDVRKLNKNPPLPYWNNDGYRLPTEAEFEYAARGGQKSLGSLYPGGIRLQDVAWFKGNSNRTLKNVGLLYPNELGLFDMSGNVSEWCWDWFDPDYYYASPVENPLGAGSGKDKVIRGGSVRDMEDFSMVTSRQGLAPSRNSPFTGFRVVRTGNPPDLTYLSPKLPSREVPGKADETPPSTDALTNDQFS